MFQKQASLSLGHNMNVQITGVVDGLNESSRLNDEEINAHLLKCSPLQDIFVNLDVFLVWPVS